MFFSIFFSFYYLVPLQRTSLRISQIIYTERSIEGKGLDHRLECQFSCLWGFFVFWFLFGWFGFFVLFCGLNLSNTGIDNVNLFISQKRSGVRNEHLRL